MLSHTSKSAAVAAAAALLAALSAPAQSQGSKDWVDIQDAGALRALHSNTTMRGKMGEGSPFVAYYRSDGKALLLWKERRIPRTWAVKGNDQVCHSDEFGTNCYRYRRHRTNHKELISERVSDAHTSFLVIEDGIPQF